MRPHLLAAISFHGFGHIAQTAPVLNELKRRKPDLRLSVLCSAPYELLRTHIQCDFEHWREATDVGVVNQGALRVRVADTARAYAALHADWDTKVKRFSAEFKRREISAVYADIPYLPLAAAARAGLSSVALCSLNWADIFRHYIDPNDPAAALAATMTGAYAGARFFLQPEPSMAMTDLGNTRRIGPIARVGAARVADLRRALGVAGDSRLVLVSLGGIKTDLGMERWPRVERVTWLVQADWKIRHPDARAWDAAGFNFIDTLRSSDAFITKPGYGSFAEAACNGARVLYVPRLDWPEEACLIDWLPRQVPCAAVSKEQFHAGDFRDALEALFAAPPRPAVAPTGIGTAVDTLLGVL